MTPKRVVLLGKGDLSIKIGKWFANSRDYALVSVVPTIPEPIWSGSLSQWARNNGVPVIESGDYREIVIDEQTSKPDLLFSVFYDKIIDGDFIAGTSRILNLHLGPLPRYRGVSPINWALKNREEFHGVTIHEITRRVDAGPIVAQVIFSIYPEFEEVIDVYRRALAFAWDLFLETIPILDRVRPRPQDESLTLHHTRKQDDQLGDRRFFTRIESLPR